MTPLSGLQLQPINTNHKITFDCGDGDLNDFFCNEAIGCQKELIAKTYQCTMGSDVIAMFSVSNDTLSLTNRAKNRAYPRSKRFSYYPAVKIARLGVASPNRGVGIGTKVMNFLKIFFLVRNKTGCRYITVDAYNKERTLNFYLKNGFDYYTKEDEKSDTRTMFLDLLPYTTTIQEDASSKRKIAEAIRSIMDASE
jgi:GNAT superfamily N-acetyltransferase